MDINSVLNQFYTLIGDPKTLIIIGLIAVGYVCKKVQFIPDNLIPLILLGISLVGAPFLISPIKVALFDGAIFAALAVFLNELIGKYVISAVEKWTENYVKSKLGNGNNNNDNKN